MFLFHSLSLKSINIFKKKNKKRRPDNLDFCVLGSQPPCKNFKCPAEEKATWKGPGGGGTMGRERPHEYQGTILEGPAP